MGEPLSDFVSRYLDAHRRRDADAVSGLYANEAQRSSPFGTSSGRAAVRGSYVNYWGSLSDDRMNINCVSGDRDDVVFIEWTQDAIHTAPFRSADGGVIEATGKSFTLRGLTVLEIADGLIAQERSYFDRLSLLAQLGLDGGPR